MGLSAGRKKIHTITAAEMREINRSTILELIRSSGPLARSQIAELLDVSLPTVMRIVDELIEDGLVVDNEEKEWSGGRKRTRVRFNGDQHLVIGIDLGGTKIFGAVADLNGKIYKEIYLEHGQTQAAESLETLFQTIDQLLEFAQTTSLNLRGIGIGIPGVVNTEKGVVKLAPALNWTNFPLLEHLQKRYPYPITIENDVNLAALGETWFGADEDETNVVLITIGTGVGAGIIINGMIYHGANFMAGEIGYFLPSQNLLGNKYPGFGAFEQESSGLGIAEQARLKLRGLRSEEELKGITAEDVFTAARRQIPWAVEIIDNFTTALAQLIIAVSVIFDPDAILLGGGVSKSADLLIDPIRQHLEGVMPILPAIRTSHLGYRAGMMGAIIALLRITTNYYSLQKFD